MSSEKNKVFVSGCYDLLHSGHVEFFRQASQYGDLYVGIGSDATIAELKHHRSLYSERERLFMVKAIRYVTDAFINSGSGALDFAPDLERLKPDVFVVNEDGGSDEKREFCRSRGIRYIVLERQPYPSLEARSSTGLKKYGSAIPTRLDLAGTWIDQPYVSCFAPGWAITLSIEPTFDIRPRCGLSTSTRNAIMQVWPYRLPDMDPEKLAKLVFCFENDPERSDGVISGAQDAIGICVPGLSRHYYNNRYWPEKIESCMDERILGWLEEHICMIPMFPRRNGCSVVKNKDITYEKVVALSSAASGCWDAIMAMDLERFAECFRASFDAQVAMFPGMVNPTYDSILPSLQPESGHATIDASSQDSSGDGFLPSVSAYIEKYSAMDGVLAWKMPGAGGGGYLVLVCRDGNCFPDGAIRIAVRRAGM